MDYSIKSTSSVQLLLLYFNVKLTPSFRCTQKASAALHQKHKAVALSYLRSRKQLEDLLTKRLGSLHTLESTFIRVEAAAGDVEVGIFMTARFMAQRSVSRS
jgi:hypothetical protein